MQKDNLFWARVDIDKKKVIATRYNKAQFIFLGIPEQQQIKETSLLISVIRLHGTYPNAIATWEMKKKTFYSNIRLSCCVTLQKKNLCLNWH